MWDKGDPLDQRILSFTAGEDHVLDNRLVPYDVRASIAHADMLAARDLISRDVRNQIVEGLEAIAAQHQAGEWVISLEEEDVHTALERRLTERAPAAGPSLHLGRSRNDQVLAAVRLYLKDACRFLHEAARRVADTLDSLGERESATGDAEFREALGQRFCRRDPGRRPGPAGCLSQSGQEPAWLRGRLWRTTAAAGP